MADPALIGAAPSPPPKARRTWLWVLLIAVNVLLFAGAGTFFYFSWSRDRAAPPDKQATTRADEPKSGAAVAGATVKATPAANQQPSVGKPEPDKAVVIEAASFRRAAAADWDEAVKQFSAPEAASRFEAVDVLGSDEGRATAWSYLLDTALICPGTAGGQSVVIGYYHPWSDVMLLTAWKKVGQGSDDPPRIVDVELVMGDFLRRRGPAKLEAGPPPAYRKLYPPLGIGLAAAETVRAFEALFYTQRPSGGWRSAFAALSNDEALAAARIGAHLAVNANMGGLAGVIDHHAGSPAQRQARDAFRRFLIDVRGGHPEAALAAAPKTLPEAHELLVRMKLGDWDRYKAASFITDDKTSVLSLSRGDLTDRYLALRFVHRPETGEAQLDRIDLFSFTAIYSDFDQLKQRAGR